MYGVTADVRAKITIIRDSYVRSGYRPVHQIGNYRTTGMHSYFTEDKVEPGTCVEGSITFISPELYPKSLEKGMRIEFYEGRKLAGYADIIEIYNDVLKK